MGAADEAERGCGHVGMLLPVMREMYTLASAPCLIKWDTLESDRSATRGGALGMGLDTVLTWLEPATFASTVRITSREPRLEVS